MANKTYIVENTNNPIESDFYKDIIQKDSNGNPLVDDQNRIRVKRYVVHGSVGLNEASVDAKINTAKSELNSTITDLHHVTTDTTQTISGNKTFTGETRVPTVDSSDSSTKAASTAFVQGKVTALQNTLNTFLDSDDTTLDQASELVAAIKANKTDIASLISDKATKAELAEVANKANAITVADTAPNVANMPVASGVMHPSQNIITENLDVSILALQQNLWAYDSTRDYAVGSYVFDENKDICKCIQANGPTNIHAPSDSAYWLRVATEDFVNTSINNLNIIRKNDGNDYYDDSDITSLIYAGNGEGTIRNEIANGNFARVHPGQTIVGRVTGTTYIVVGCNIYKHRGDTELTQNHIGLMPIQLIGNDGNLLWSGRTWAGSGVNNTIQGYAPWASDNETEGKNQTSCYKDSYIANTVLPKVDNLWLKPDFENQGISVLTFRNLEAISFDTNATCMSNPNWRGCATSWGWTSRRLVLPSEPEIYGHYHWSGSPWESGLQHTQLPLYRHKEIHKVYPRVDIWLKDSASASDACFVYRGGHASSYIASHASRVCPVFLIA